MSELLFTFEGISRSGKSTLQSNLKKKHPEYVYYDGFSLLNIGLEKWQHYIELEHKILDKLNRMNMEKPIICDRLLSELVYAEDGEKWMHTFKHHKLRLIYVEAKSETLEERNTKDPLWKALLAKHESVMLPNFRHISIDTSDSSIDECTKQIEKYISSEIYKEVNALKKGAKS